MKAILKEIRYDEKYVKEHLRDEGLMFGVFLMFQCQNSSETYSYTSTFPNIFYPNEKKIDGYSVTELQNKIDEAKLHIGKSFNVNLYKISVNEITNGNYNGIAFYNYYDELTHIFHEFRVASYKTRIDVIKELQFKYCKRVIEGDAVIFDEKDNEIEVTDNIKGISIFLPEVVAPQKEEIVNKIYHMYYEDNWMNDFLHPDLLGKMHAIFLKEQRAIYKGCNILGNPC